MFLFLPIYICGCVHIACSCQHTYIYLSDIWPVLAHICKCLSSYGLFLCTHIFVIIWPAFAHICTWLCSYGLFLPIYVHDRVHMIWFMSRLLLVYSQSNFSLSYPYLSSYAINCQNHVYGLVSLCWPRICLCPWLYIYDLFLVLLPIPICLCS